MKINTEIIQRVFIISCEGDRFDASFLQTFLISMQDYIRKGHTDIILDLSKVVRVDSTGLGGIVRLLKETNGRGHLILCGVDDMVVGLLKITHLATAFIHAANRAVALNRLGVVQKRIKPVAATPVPKSISAPPQSKGFDTSLLSSLQMEDADTTHEDNNSDRRKHRRLTHKQIMSKDIVVYCTNSGTGMRTTAIIDDISPGGILVVSSVTFPVGNDFLVEGRIGKNFKYSEHAVVRHCRGAKYSFEFTMPSRKITSFLHQLTGAVLCHRH